MASGYVYVLVNSSMLGLVKVGKTTKLPAERAEELSRATGVATPFIVAFAQHFLDCDAAEKFVHTELQRHGMRCANNREFFRADATDVIRAVLLAPGRSDGSQAKSWARDATDGDLLSTDDQSDGPSSGSPPWADILEAADAHYFGLGETMQDFDEALKLYRDAVRLGSVVAYQQIGDIYRSGKGGKKDIERALASYKEGASKGNYYGYANMARIFAGMRKIENAKKAWSHFFKARHRGVNEEVEKARDNEYFDTCSYYLAFCQRERLAVAFQDELPPDVTAARHAQQMDSSDGPSCFVHIMEHRIRVDGLRGGVERSLGELCAIMRGALDDAVSAEIADATLKRTGIFVKDNYAFVSNTHSAIADILRGTPWPVNWRNWLKTMPGAISSDNSLRYGATKARAVGIPFG